MAAICRVTLIGFLSRDPESDYTPNGTLRIKFSIPVNRRYTDRNGQDQESTAWYNVSVLGRRADGLMKLIEMGALVKGKQVYVDGRLDPREWTDKEGKNRTSLDVLADNIELLGTRGDSQGGNFGGARGGGSSGGSTFDDDGGEAPIDNVPF